MIKEAISEFLACVMLALGGSEAALPADKPQPEQTSANTAIITIDPNYDGAQTAEITAAIGEVLPSSRLVSTNWRLTFRYGYDHVGYFYDDACTQPVGDQITVTGDTTVYGGWTPWSAEDKALMDLYLTERDYYERITSYPLAFEESGFVNYFKTAKGFFDTRIAKFTADQMPALEQVQQAREALQPLTDDWNSTVWYIWGENMPQAPDADSYDYYMKLDYPGFRPFLVPYMAADQSVVKGNIIVVAGGGFSNRSNMFEGYATAKYFQSQNYNAFVLQRRVDPSEEIDSSLDLQRAIRYLQWNADALGIANSENISACGYSCGGMTVTNFIQNFTADSLPNAIYADYVPDAIDQTPAELDAMLIIYGAPAGGFTNVESLVLPDTFIACGEDDTARKNCLEFYQQIVDLTRAELYIYADAGHGIGLGETRAGTYTAASQWPDLAVEFLDISYGYDPAFVASN